MPMLVCACGKFVFLEDNARNALCPQCGEPVAVGKIGGRGVRVSGRRRARVTLRHRGDMYLSNLLDTMPRSSPVRWWWVPAGVALLAAAIPATAKFLAHGFVLGLDLAAAGLFATAGSLSIALAAFDARPGWRAWVGMASAMAMFALQHRDAPLEGAYWLAASIPAFLAGVMGAHLATSYIPDSTAAGRIGLGAGAAFAVAAGGAAWWVAAESLDGLLRWLAARWPVAAIGAAFVASALAAVANRFCRSRALARAGWWVGAAAAGVTLAMAGLAGDLPRFAAVWAPPALLCVSVAEAVVAPHIPKP